MTSDESIESVNRSMAYFRENIGSDYSIAALFAIAVEINRCCLELSDIKENLNNVGGIIYDSGED